MHTLKTILVFGCMMTTASELASQQLPLFTQYREYHNYLNPGAIPHEVLAYDHASRVSISYRSQWNIPGGPRTLMAQASSVLKNRFSAGIQILSDQAGPIGFSGANVKLGAVLGDTYYNFVSGGLSLGYYQYRIDQSELQGRDQDAINNLVLTDRGYVDVGLGLFGNFDLRDHLKIYGGLSTRQMIASESANRTSHLFVNLGAYLFSTNYSFFQPSLWIRSVTGAKLSADFNLRYHHDDTFWFGAGYATSGSLHAEAGVILADLISKGQFTRIGFGIGDVYQSDVRGTRFGQSYEFNLAFSF